MKKIFFALAFALTLSACDNIEEDVEWIDFDSDAVLHEILTKGTDKDKDQKDKNVEHPIDILPRIN